MITARPMAAPMSSGTNAPRAPAELPSKTGSEIANMSVFISFYSSYMFFSSSFSIFYWVC